MSPACKEPHGERKLLAAKQKSSRCLEHDISSNIEIIRIIMIKLRVEINIVLQQNYTFIYTINKVSKCYFVYIYIIVVIGTSVI